MNQRKARATGVASGVAAALLAFGAWADDPASQPTFESFDKDGNGQISAAESAAHEELGGRLALLDSDGDGAVSRDEFERLQVAEAAGPAASSESASSESASSGSTSSATANTPSSDPQSPAESDDASGKSATDDAANRSDDADEKSPDAGSAAQTPPDAQAR